MLVLRSLQVQLLSDETGTNYRACSAFYTVGSTDDVQLSRSMTTSIQLSDADAVKAASLIGDIAARIKANEGIE